MYSGLSGYPALEVLNRDAGGEGAVVFGRSVHPILTRGADYAHPITTCPPGISDLTTAPLTFSTNYFILLQMPKPYFVVFFKLPHVFWAKFEKFGHR